jgi:hypothetical protein
MQQQSLQIVDALDIVPSCGSVDALLEAKHVPLDVLPGERTPVFSS